MKRQCVVYVCGVLLTLFALPLFAQSNAAPSLKVALNPNCKIADAQSLTANVATGIATQDVCNIAANATSIGVYVTVAAASSGSLKIWEADGAEPGFAAITYPSGTTSYFADPRLCAPHFECSNGISVKATSNVTLTLIPSAYYFEPSQ